MVEVQYNGSNDDQDCKIDLKYFNFVCTVGTRFNEPEGTGDFWSLNLNVVKSNFQISFIDINRFMTMQLRLVSVSNQ